MKRTPINQDPFFLSFRNGCSFVFRPAHCGRSGPDGSRPGFTLIELLTVIAIIGVLAALTMGVTGLAARKRIESRVTTELQHLAMKIEGYRDAMGFYPPDNPLARANPGMPYPPEHSNYEFYATPLFYELSGTTFQNHRFRLLNAPEELNTLQIKTYFNREGFSNSARERNDVRYRTDFRPSQHDRISSTVPVEGLVVPVRGPRSVGPNNVNPWHYVSTNPTHNPSRFDLWADVMIGKKVYRFSNWSKDPIELP